MSQNNQYNTIEEALRDLREGKVILVTDDPDRENEGDLICAAEFATQENINFMATYAKGLICTPMSAEIAAKLNFPPMVAENTDNHGTAFTVAVDHADTTTGSRAFLYDPKMCGRGGKTGRFQKTGTCISSYCQKRRCSGKKRSHRGNDGSYENGRTERMRCVL